MIVKAQSVLPCGRVYRAEKLIGPQHRDFPAIERGMPVGVVAVEEDDITRAGESSPQRHGIRLALRDLDLARRA